MGDWMSDLMIKLIRYHSANELMGAIAKSWGFCINHK